MSIVDLTAEQKGLFLLWANTKLNLRCSSEKELRSFVGDKVIDELLETYCKRVNGGD